MQEARSRTRLCFASVALASLALGSVNLSAAQIPVTAPFYGELDIANQAGLLVGVSTTTGAQTGCINFGKTVGQNTNPCPAGVFSNMSVSGADATDFTFPSTGLIQNIPQGTVSISQWEKVNSPLPGGIVFFDLTGVPNAVAAANDCASGNVGSQCAAGPFLLQQSGPTNVTITFLVSANAYTGIPGTGVTPYTATFQTTITGINALSQFGCTTNCSATIPNILFWEGGGGTINSTWSATEAPSVPEPISFLLFGSGLIGVALIGRARRRRRS